MNDVFQPARASARPVSDQLIAQMREAAGQPPTAQEGPELLVPESRQPLAVAEPDACDRNVST